MSPITKKTLKKNCWTNNNDVSSSANGLFFSKKVTKDFWITIRSKCFSANGLGGYYETSYRH